MGLFILIIALVLIALGTAVLLLSRKLPGRRAVLTPNESPRTFPPRQRITERSTNERRGAQVVGGALLLFGLLLLFFDSYTTVGARGVTVQTAFGKIQGAPLGPGWHWVRPWNNLEEFDASVQTLKFHQAEPNDNGDCLTVRLGNSTLACVDVTTQWNINHLGDVNALYLQYKTFDNIHDNLVKRQLGSALNEIFGNYDPLAAINSGTGTPTVNTHDLQSKVMAVLQRDLGREITITSVTIPVVHFDGDTENRLKSYQQAKADTRIAEQQKQTAVQQGLAAKELAAQPGLDKPGVQYQNCLNLTHELAKLGQLGQLPPTWNCNGSSNMPLLLQSK